LIHSDSLDLHFLIHTFVEYLFLFDDCITRDLGSTFVRLLVLTQSHFESGENSQELLVVDSKLVGLPETVNKAVEGFVVHIQLQAPKDVLETVAGNQPCAFCVNDFEEVRHASNAGFVCSFNHLVDDVFVGSSVSNTVSLKLANKFTIVNGTTLVRIYRVPQSFNLHGA
jgi:hypothetical protein